MDNINLQSGVEKMTTKQKAIAIIHIINSFPNLISQRQHYTFDEVIELNRGRERVYSRKIIAKILYKYEHIVFQDIANLLNYKSHATVMINDRVFDGEIETNKEVRELYNKVEKIYELHIYNTTASYSPNEAGQTPLLKDKYYELYHKKDGLFVVWCKRELVSIDVYSNGDEIDYYPFPYFEDTEFPFEQITKRIKQFNNIQQ